MITWCDDSDLWRKQAQKEEADAAAGGLVLPCPVRLRGPPNQTNASSLCKMQDEMAWLSNTPLLSQIGQ